MDNPVNLCIFFALGCLTVYLVHNHVGEIVYFLTMKWRESVFLVACGFAGLLAAPYLKDISPDMPSVPSLSISLPSISPASGGDDGVVAGDIAICKKFVSANIHGQSYAPDGLSHSFFSFGPLDPWEACARTFGMNYWKYDISIDGKNGGKLLCDVYGKRGAEPSDKVEGWCQTVFAAQPLKLPKNQRI